jgi:hypothetical protein
MRKEVIELKKNPRTQGLSMFACLLTITVLAASTFIPKLAGPDGKTFTKEWTGAIGTIEGNVTITDTAQNVWYNGPVPLDRKIVIHNIPHGTVFMIAWKDWRGVQQERWVVECVDNESYLLNTIPFPKSAPPTTLIKMIEVF